MTLTRKLQSKALLVLILGTLGLMTAPAPASAEPPWDFCDPGCWSSCSLAIGLGSPVCQPGQDPICEFNEAPGCYQECGFSGACGEI